MLIIFSTHPIQYQAPLWKKMTEAGIEMEVWYFTDFGVKISYDAQFGQSFSWDLPMLEGYKYSFLKANDKASPNNGFNGIIIKDNIAKLLKHRKATHVYINGWQPFAYWQVLWAAKSLGLTIIFKGESNDLKLENKWKWPIKKLLLNQFFKKIDHFLYIGEANKRLYEKYNISHSQLWPGLYCVDNQRFKEQNILLRHKKNILRKQWNIPEHAFCILFSGKFISKKKPLDIIFATQQLINKYPNIHLLFVGDGELYEDIKSETNVVFDKKNKIQRLLQRNKPNITFTGFLNQTEIPLAYAVADCLILPSDYGETWGLVVNEAMASAVPVIVSDQCGSAEDLVNPIYPRLVFKTGDINGLAESIIWLIKNPIDKNLLLAQIDKYTYESTIESIKRILY